MITFNEAQIMAWLSPVFWPFLRVLALFASAPIFASRVVPMRTKIGLSFVIALCMQVSLAPQPVVSLTGPLALGAVLQQLAIGASIGLAIRIVFASVEMAGELIGLQMGLNFAGFFDPINNAQASPAGRLFGNMAMLLFIVLNGHLLMIMAVSDSFTTFPVGGGALDALRTMRLHELGAVIFSYGLWIALPMIGMLLFVNMVLGVISRIAPQMNVFAIGFPLTLSTGLLGIAFTLPMLDRPVMSLMQLLTDRLIGG